MELWERSAALALLERTLRETATGGRLALIAGEAGIGKSSLVRAFGAGKQLLWGGCDPLTTPRAAGPLQDIARQAGGALGEAASTGAAQSELLRRLVEELDGPRQRRRRIMVVEDAHWADEATLDMLVFLGRRLDRLPALLIVTYRDDEVGHDHPLWSTLAALPRTVVREVSMTPLSRACVAQRAQSVGRDADELYELTGGNPLLVTEALAEPDRRVPTTVRDLILARLRRLSPAAREVAWLVAVMPTGAEAVLLADRAAEVDECLAAGALAPRGDAIAYRHELLRRAVEDALSPARRSALHQRALALLLEAEGSDQGSDPARLAHHARHTGDAAVLLRWGLAAARDAAAKGAHREAVAHYRSVRPHAGRLSVAERADLLEEYALQAYLTGHSDEGLVARRAALVERESLGQRERVGENLRWISRLAWWSGQGAPARAAAAHAVEVLTTDLAAAADANEPGRELAMAYSNLSQLHMLAHELAETLEWGQRARELADRWGDRDTSVHAAINMDTARLLGGEVAADAALAAAHRTAAADGLADHAARALVNRCTVALQTGRYAVAAVALDEALPYAAEHDLDGYVQYLLGVRAGIRLEQGEWDAALVDAEASLSRAERMGVAVVPALVAKGRILAARGDSSALSILDRVADLAYGTGELQRIGPVAAARTEYFQLHGDPARAAEEAGTALALAEQKRHSWFVGELTVRRWQAGVAPSVTTTADLPEPHRRLLAGDWAGAAAAWAELGSRYAQAGALAYGDRPAVAQALGLLVEVRADRAAAVLRAELRRRGVTGVPRGPRATTAANTAGLTARQLDVLRLLAEGLTNAEIAGRLTLAPKTVEHHISAVLDKLGVPTRGQAIAVAHRSGLIAR